jgi:hypothetical protein
MSIEDRFARRIGRADFALACAAMAREKIGMPERKRSGLISGIGNPEGERLRLEKFVDELRRIKENRAAGK